MKPQINNKVTAEEEINFELYEELNNGDKTERKKGKKAEAKAQKEKQQLMKNIPLSTLDLIPVKNYISDGYAEKGYLGFELKNSVDNPFMNIYEICRFDYMNKSDNEVLTHIMIWDRFYRTHYESIKLLSINLPVDIQDNIAFHKRKYNKTQNQLYREVLKDDIRDFLRVKGRNNKKFYLFVYAKSLDDLVKLNGQVRTTLEQSGLVMQIDTRQKVIVLNKVSNPYNNSYKTIKDV